MTAILSALIALPKIGALISQAISALLSAYIQLQNQETMKEISDAAFMSARAKSEDDRFKAAEAWRTALSRSRIE